MKTILKNIMLFAAGALTLGFTACEEAVSYTHLTLPTIA